MRIALGGVSDMTLWRWMNNPALRFPKPIKIQMRRYWREDEVAAWLEQREVTRGSVRWRAEDALVFKQARLRRPKP